MENAAKALIIAGGGLLLVLVLTLAMFIFKRMATQTSSFYNEMSDTNKAASNMLKFINMINTKDYKHAYELLDNTFRQNNFNNIDSFEKYVKDNFYNINYNDDSYDINTQNDYYTCMCKIKNSNEENAQEKTLNIVMQLKEGTDFVM